LSEKDQQTKLVNYLKLFTVEYQISQTTLKDDKWVFKFIWPDKDEGKDIINDVFHIALSILEKNIFVNLDDLIKELKKSEILKNDLMRNKILREAATSKTVEIYVDALRDKNKLSQNNFQINSAREYLDDLYILSYNALNKEIDQIQSLTNTQFNKVTNDLEELKKIDFNWVRHNLFLIDGNTKLIKKNKIKVLKNLLGLGLAIGLFYIFILNFSKFRRILKN
jgi:hypothetical protein